MSITLGDDNEGIREKKLEKLDFLEEFLNQEFTFKIVRQLEISLIIGRVKGNPIALKILQSKP